MINFTEHSGIYTLETTQFVPTTLEKAWRFFSSPANLAKITPDHMGFQITSEPPGRMYPGQIISYRVGVIPFITMNWVTEITHVSEGSYFVDEQRFGPYSMWHHEHHFTPVDGGVMMRDKVSYKVPLGILGRIAHALFIKRQLTQIFTHRIQALDQFFPSRVTSEAIG